MEKVTLWVPTASKRPESWEQVESYMRMSVPENVSQMYFRRSVPGNVLVIWNEVVKEFLESDSDWLWSVHDDVVFHVDTLPRLMSWGKPLISALVFHRSSPVLPHLWKQYEPGGPYAMQLKGTKDWFMQHLSEIRFSQHIMEPRPEDALVEVGFTSTSCTLIHRKVLEAMREEMQDKWFQMDSETAGGGEDRNFFEHALKAGFPAYVDRSCIAGHIIGNVVTGAADFMMWDSMSTFTNTGEEKNESQILIPTIAENLIKSNGPKENNRKRH